ncbi:MULTISPECIES: LysR family transcriptional regulator [unclassified Rhizobium]|uniref:LysR family transcriptional regulator n=1 Tax=unclassified Rhizobium TaxID=2613769 RepID=UPI000BA88D70|nr:MULTISPECIES: LysR family transcriptional regulator [unclassified Rhizobium]ASW10803.1 LysR family transcriptional regulator [Rhizobium sp. 11515TR]MDK4715307.1 LysR family transcriptional regulator [Rhizobium sp. CNPSo 4039]
MELEQIRCFVAVAEELHFGRAAQRLGILPASIGRHIRMLEESLGVVLFSRTTRSVSLSEEGILLLDEVKPILARLDAVAEKFRATGRKSSPLLRIGAIDSAAAGLVPLLLHDFRAIAPNAVTQLVEDKSIRLIPKLLAGRLDIALIRPRDGISRSLVIKPLLHETAVVAIASTSPLALKDEIRIVDLSDEPLIVPERRSRPHSHDLTMTLFSEFDMRPRIAQVADEKQTIINLVAAGIGSAIVPRWTSKLAVHGVTFVPLADHAGTRLEKLPLAVAWVKAVRDPTRDLLLNLLEENIKRYSEFA